MHACVWVRMLSLCVCGPVYFMCTNVHACVSVRTVHLQLLISIHAAEFLYTVQVLPLPLAPGIAGCSTSTPTFTASLHLPSSCWKTTNLSVTNRNWNVMCSREIIF